MIPAEILTAILEVIYVVLMAAEVVSIMVSLISIVWFIKYLVKSAIQVSKWWHKEEKA